MTPKDHFVMLVRLLVFLPRDEECQELTSKAVDIHSGLCQPNTITTGKKDTDIVNGRAKSPQDRMSSSHFLL